MDFLVPLFNHIGSFQNESNQTINGEMVNFENHGKYEELERRKIVLSVWTVAWIAVRTREYSGIRSLKKKRLP